MRPDASPGSAFVMQSFVPMGLLSLKATADLADVGADITVIEVNGLINAGMIPNDDAFYDHVAGAIVEDGDALVGLMTDADSLHHSLLIAEAVKRRSTQTLVCLGGPASSPISRTILEACPSVDLVVRGEGELAFVDLIRSVRRGRRHPDVQGLTWRAEDRIIENAGRALIDDLDKLPIPAFDAYDVASGSPLYLDVGRGCPFECRFCSTSPFWRRKFRMKSIARIVEEMTLLRDRYGRRHVNLSHDIFTCDREWTRRFCERLVAEGIAMTWTCSTRTDIVDAELLDEMARAGCVEIYYGIESGAPELQRRIQKNLDIDRALDIVRSTVDAGIHPITGFIVGYPMETRHTLEQTLKRFFEFLREGRYRAHLFPLCPYHESPMYHEYRDTAVEPAESYDLTLTAAARARGDCLKATHPVMLASTYRYHVPEVPANLISACEELSAQLVVLKAIWPVVLSHYESVLDWYVQWVCWIEKKNTERNRDKRRLHQGDAADLLQFVVEEAEQRRFEDAALMDLIRYERLKLGASTLTRRQPRTSESSQPITADDIVVVGCDYLADEFHHDIRSLLAGSRRAARDGLQDQWVVVVRECEGDLKTLQTSAFGKAVLDLATQPRRVIELLDDIIGSTNASCDQHELVAEGLHLIDQLLAQGLLERVVSHEEVV